MYPVTEQLFLLNDTQDFRDFDCPLLSQTKKSLSMGMTEVFTHYCSTFLSIAVGSVMKELEVPTILKIRLTATMALCFVLHSTASKFCDSLRFLAIVCIELAVS